MDTKWSFTPYEKISESSAHWDHKSAPKLFKKAAAVRGQADTSTKWVVTEKVHGANFCILCDGVTTVCAKRTQVLDPEDEFFGYATVHEKYRQNILQAYAIVKAEHAPNMSKMYLFGELFGGGYPHPEFPLVIQENLVQTGVYYCPHLDFYAFDIAVASLGNDQLRDYLDYDKAIDIFKKCNLFFAEPLMIGSFEEVSNFKVGFQSTIPKKLGMPPLPFPNVAEGVVVKSIRSALIDAQKGKVRATLKIKDKNFVEEKPLPVDAQKDPYILLVGLAAGLVTENRKNNAISKLGKVRTEEQKEQLALLLVEDVLEALQEKEGRGSGRNLWERLSAKGKNEVKDHVHRVVRAFLGQKKER